MMISVVIPLYNKEKQIAKTLETVLSQTYQDYEIVIVNDGSTDGSIEEVKKFDDSRIRLIIQDNAGVSAARNKGIEEARGEYVAFLDADDIWDKEHLDNIVGLMKRYPQCRAFATSYRNNQNGKNHRLILNKLPFKENTGILTNYFEVCSYSHPPVWSSAVCVKKGLLQEIGGFPIGIKSGEDLLTWARIAVKTDWAYSLKPTATYMLPLGNTYTESPVRPNDDGDPVAQGLLALLKTNYLRKRELRHYIGRFYKMKASTNLRYGFRIKTITDCLSSLRFRPFARETYPILILALMPRRLQKKIFAIHSYDKVASAKDVKILFGGVKRSSRFSTPS